MARIVCIISGLTGILHAGFELMARLKAAGHDLSYAAPRSVGHKVKAQGIHFVKLPEILAHPAPEMPAIDGPFRRLRRMAYKIQYAKSRKEAALQRLGTQQIRKIMQAFQADLFLIDLEMHEYIITAYTDQHPFLLLSQWFSTWKRPGLPYLLRDTIPGEGWRGSPLAIELDWQRVRSQRWWTFLKQKLRSLSTDRRSVLMNYAQQSGFPMSLIRENYWPGPFSYDQLPVISMTMEALEFPHVSRPGMTYVGPMVCEARKEAQNDPVFEATFQKILERKSKQSARLVYCSVSTLSEGDTRFISRLIKAFEGQHQWILIIALGGLQNPEVLGQLPDNVFAFAWVPQLKILAHSDCSINHGGIHTINECIHFRIPMLIYSGKRSDQNGCAARMAYHQVGLMADKDQDDEQAIREKVHRVLTDPKIAMNINKMYRRYQQYRSSRRLEQVVDHTIQHSAQQDRSLPKAPLLSGE